MDVAYFEKVEDPSKYARDVISIHYYWFS